VDAHLGDGLFLLTSAVHAEISLQGEKSENLRMGAEDAGSPRRYQRRFVNGQKDFVLFAPSGPSHRYFSNYCARINAGGYRPKDVFPVGADLRVVYLQDVYLLGADLSEADLRGADLSAAYLGGVDLRHADLRYADLHHAFLGGAVFIGADLRGADLNEAYLSRADLLGADLRGADLRGADLGGAVIDPEQLKLARGGETEDNDQPSDEINDLGGGQQR
jgi:hypothetical protein